jgi:hypothetical protein
MNRPRNGRDWAGLIALVLSVTLALVLLITVIGLVVFGGELSEEGGRLLTGIGLGLVAAVSAYLGSQIGRRGGDG